MKQSATILVLVAVVSAVVADVSHLGEAEMRIVLGFE